MSFDQLLAFCAFAAIGSVTPGPNNTMMLASGLNHGFVRSLPHLAGISIGFTLMVLSIGLGLHAVFVQLPALQAVLKYAGAAYLLWLAWQLAKSAPMGSQSPAAGAKPMSFLAAAAFQWVNPKAWVMAVGAVTTYLPHSFQAHDALLLALVFGVVNAPCVGAWAAFGVAMRRVLQDARSVRVFNFIAAGLLVASLYPILAA
ncbi:LysE family translocator [Eleftheria terrae]|uniref:LysE family translocator n=1 Tax=Eleftheria terrae TaxID=1597781 RepID=UPI00263B3D4B|nr:LysE family translocator [Eleftheria terrae]WKB53040.1 LysE family translocator [Eleftheria terrae]